MMPPYCNRFTRSLAVDPKDAVLSQITSLLLLEPITFTTYIAGFDID